MTEAEAQAVKTVADTTGKVVDLVRDGGSFLARTVGTIPEDILGIAGGDWLHQQRRRNRAKMEAKTEALLEGFDKSRISDPSPSVVVPLMQAAADEGREALQDMWAALLARAMIDGGRGVRREYFDAVRQMEPVDIMILRLFATLAPDDTSINVDGSAKALEVNDSELQVSYNALNRVGCLAVMHRGVGPYRLTSFGRELLRLATSVDGNNDG